MTKMKNNTKKGELSILLSLLALTIAVVGMTVGFNISQQDVQNRATEAFSLPSPTFESSQNSAITLSNVNIEPRSGSSTQYILNGSLCFNASPPNNGSFRVKVGRSQELGSSVLRQIGNANLAKCGSGTMPIGAVFNEPSTSASTLALTSFEVWVDASWTLSEDTIGSVFFDLPSSPTPAGTATPLPTRDPNATRTPTPRPTVFEQPVTLPPSPVPPGPIFGTVTVHGADEEYDFIRVVRCDIKDLNAPLIESKDCEATGNLKTSFRSSYDYRHSISDDPTKSLLVYAEVMKTGQPVMFSNRRIDCPTSPQNVEREYMCVVRGASRQNFNINLSGSGGGGGGENSITINIRLYNYGSLKATHVNARLCLVESENTCAATVTETVPDNLLKPGNGTAGADNPENYGRWIDQAVPKVEADKQHQLEIWGTFEGDKEGVKRVSRAIPAQVETITIAQAAVAIWHSGVVGDSSDLKMITNESELADINSDGCVNANDFSRIVSNYYSEAEPNEYSPEDINLDGVVNGVDLSYIYPNWLSGNCRLNNPTP